MVEARRPSLLQSGQYNGLTHEAELAHRRHLSHERSQRAAAEALRALRAERNRSTQHHVEAEIGTPPAAAKDPAI